MSKSLPLPPTVDCHRIMWMYLVVIGGFHLLLPLAFLPAYFSWWYVLLLIPGNYVFGSLGINLAYHRLLTHRSLETPRWLERLVTLFGVCSLQGSPLRWVTIHRIHHQFSDEQEDPHTPLVTFMWSHVNWLFLVDTQLERLSTYERHAPDLLEDPFQRWLHRKYTWLWVYLIHAVILGLPAPGVAFLIAAAPAEVLTLATGLFLWGVVVRTVYVWHITWFVNSLSHYAGYQNYDTRDQSRNNWFVALLTNGEGWHNNHHAAPRAAAHGHRWWEIDLTYWTIVVLRWLGLAWKVVPVKVPRAMLKQAAGEGDAEAVEAKREAHEQQPAPAPEVPLIRCEHVQREYPDGNVVALRDVNFEIARGEFVAIMGPSGSGKSTLLNLLGGPDRPTSGAVWVDGVKLETAAQLDDLRVNKVGFVFQAFHLLPTLTACENVQVPMFEGPLSTAGRKKKAIELLEQVGMGHRLDHLPGKLSAGERQRVAIARALANDPLMLLADEPTGNLDTATGEAILQLFERLHRDRGMTLVVVTHSAEVGGRAHRLIRLRDGCIIEDRVQGREGAAAV